ncbi:hypothetical protein KO465_09115 [Candidatus Micrarchaeota archaeon]|jgi:hypothetical protein|nr:hypothetical protein [Candidatus Micrarchaeota archaeon]
MSITVKDTPENQVEEAKTPEETVVSTSSKSEILQNAVADVFDLDRNEVSKYQDKIDTLLEYAKTQSDKPSRESIMWALRNLEMKLGSPPLSEKRINYVARFAYLAKQQSEIKKEMDSYIPYES